jgi:hypothetical protein
MCGLPPTTTDWRTFENGRNVPDRRSGLLIETPYCEQSSNSPHRLILPFQLPQLEAKQIAEQQEQVYRRAIAVAEEVEGQQATE